MFLIVCNMKQSVAFSYQVKTWDLYPQDVIDTITTHRRSLFLTHNRHLQWFQPVNVDQHTDVLQNRFFSKTVQNVIVQPKTMVVRLLSEDPTYMTESVVFAKGKHFSFKWTDSTLYETIVESNQYVLRSNFWGVVHYGSSPTDMQKVTLRMPDRRYYTSMVVCGSYLWCVGDGPNRSTRVDGYEMTCSSDKDTIHPIPRYTFHIDSHDCMHPLHIKACIQECFPKKTMYIVIGYAIGGACIANVHTYPPISSQQTLSSHWVRCDNAITSISFDYPYLYFLEKGVIHMYHIPAVLTLPKYIASHKVSMDMDYKQVTQIAAIKRHVFWNGESTLHGIEITD